MLNHLRDTDAIKAWTVLLRTCLRATAVELLTIPITSNQHTAYYITIINWTTHVIGFLITSHVTAPRLLVQTTQTGPDLGIHDQEKTITAHGPFVYY